MCKFGIFSMLFSILVVSYLFVISIVHYCSCGTWCIVWGLMAQNET